jgi:PleD family two-component response regulator
MLIEQCARCKCRLALLIIDVDDSKQINDTVGHLEVTVSSEPLPTYLRNF